MIRERAEPSQHRGGIRPDRDARRRHENVGLCLTELDFAARERTLGFSGVEWLDVQYGTGKIKVGVEYVENRAGKLTIDDFDLLTVVGKGSFGKVMQVKKKDTNRIYAVKTIRKAHIISRSEVAHTLAERSVLAQINNPFIVPLKFSFQSPEKLYFVLAFVNGGELFHHLQVEHTFNEERSRFYTAELLLALEHLHELDVVYRYVIRFRSTFLSLTYLIQ